jgi:hypothetical protein
MNVVWAALIIVGAAAVGVAALLLARRRAPEGSHFKDGDRAAGVFGVLATGLSVLLGFVVVLAFQSYDDSRSGAETEALLVAQLFETAQFLPTRVGRQLSGELVCYGRSVVHQEWRQLEDGSLGTAIDPLINPWAIAMFRTLKTANPTTVPEETAYSKWLDQTSDREQARNDRIHGSEGVIPTPLWIVLFFASAIIFAFTLFFADSGEHAIAQAMLAGSVVAVIAASLLLLRFLDNPYRPGVGSLRPVAMERTLKILELERRVVKDTTPLPCDAEGKPL